MKLTKREAKYRTKLIQEGQYTKTEQQILDEYKAETGSSYYDIYQNERSYTLPVVIASRLVTRSFAAVGVSARKLADNFMRLARASAEALYEIGALVDDKIFIIEEGGDADGNPADG